MRVEPREARRSNGSSNRPFYRAFSARPRHGEQYVIAFCHYSCSCPTKLKKPLRGFSCRLGNFPQCDFSRRGDRFCHDACIRWFRALSAKRDGRQIWAIYRKSTRLNSSHSQISYAVFCLKKKKYLPCTAHATRRLHASPNSPDPAV